MEAQKDLKRIDLIFGEYTTLKYKVLEKALQTKPEDIINNMVESGLKGRGGAGFPTGLKWKFTREQPVAEKYVICNADEGEPEHSKTGKLFLKFQENFCQEWAFADML